MRKDQRIRLVGMIAALVAYAGHLYVNEQAVLTFGPYDVSGFVVVAVAIILLALPETIEHIPLLPSKKS